MKKLTSISIVVLILSLSCNKTKRRSNILDGERWKVTELSVEGTQLSELPELRFSECEIYKEDCTGTWYKGEGHAKFIWQIRNKGKTLIISNQTDHAHGLDDVKAAEQCIAFSGNYEIKKCTRKKMHAESFNTYGQPGKKVVIKLEKK